MYRIFSVNQTENNKPAHLAQLVEHLVYTEAVGSSSLSVRTIYKNKGTQLGPFIFD